MLIDQYHLSQDQQFAMRIQAALAVALFAIETEDPTTPNHTARLQWVAGIRNAPGTLVAQLAFGLSAHPAVLAAYLAKDPRSSDSVDDTTLQSAVSALVTSAVGV